MPASRPQIKKKVCMLGAFGVGKTSLVRHFVHSIFDDSYLSTIGVKIERKLVPVGEVDLTLMLWDIAGEEELFHIPSGYVRGAAGCLLVADGTRPETLQTALEVKERINREVGSLPTVVLINKADLTEQWNFTDEEIGVLSEAGLPSLRTSAKTGENVERAFNDLAARLV